MDVVGQDFKLVDEPTVHLGTLDQEMLQATDHVLPEDTTAVFGNKDDMVATLVEGMSTPPEKSFVRLHFLILAQWEH